MIAPDEALQRLREGNQRFVSETHSEPLGRSRARRQELLTTQSPFAVVLSCSDSRVPPELVFDVGLGDLFVVRVAGNVANPSQVGSVEFGVEQLGARLVLVLGHLDCAAVGAALAELEDPSVTYSPNLASIVDPVREAIEPSWSSLSQLDSAELMDEAARTNIRSSMARLASGSESLERLVAQDRLVILGGLYSLRTGVVEFLERDRA